MDGAALADRLSRGMGAAARVFGTAYDVFRGEGADDPLRPERRVLRLPAAFDGGDPGYRRPAGYERALRGIFDSAYLQVGDLVRGERGVLFVALLPRLHRPLCVLTNAVVQVGRPEGPGLVGLNGYGGVVTLTPVLSGWPGSLAAGAGGSAGPLPGDGALASFTLLLPVGPPAVRAADVVADGDGRRFVVGAAELSELGWRIGLRQVGA